METSLVAQAGNDKSGGAQLEAIFDDLVRCETRLYNGADAVMRRHGLSTSQFEFLRYIHAHRDARAADMATYFAVGVGATSKGITRLEARGWITRAPNPADGRSSLLRLTADGAALLSRASEEFASFLAPLLEAGIDPRQLPRIAHALSTLRSRLEGGNIGTPTG